MKNTMVDLQILHRLLGSILPCAFQILKIVSQTPVQDWLKVNTDGATFGALDLAGYMGVFKTFQAFV